MKKDFLKKNATPKYFFDKLTDITPEDLREMKVKAVGIDLDNTSFYDSTLKPFKGVEEWVKNVKKAGFPVVIITNTYETRAKIISKKLGSIPYFANTNKPDTKYYFEAAKITNTDISEFAMIGDQLFTDIEGANEAGAVSVRVKYTAQEILLWFYYKFIVRRKEKIYLTEKGLGDKI